MPSQVGATTTMQIRPMRDTDWPGVLAAYQDGIATGEATFETDAPTFAQWSASHPAEHRFVAVDDQTVLGWVALSPVSDRCAYTGVAEVSIYVAERARGHGAGLRLLETVIAHADAAGIWTIQAGVFPENIASVALHRRAGFRIVGTRERLGELHGRWRDVLLLERRRP
jgi:L-amino acid N-acyltransferase YncA